MSSIDFFTPVNYNNQIKTIPQKILETVDDYLYLGDKFRVKIFDPNADNPQLWAMQDRQGRHHSWTHTAIKIASYCTLVLPLIALLTKATLRCYLQISSIQIQTRFSPNSQIEDRLPTELFQHIGSFLSDKDHGQLAQVGMFARDAERDAQQYHMDLMAPLKAEIQALPADPLTREDFQRLLVGLITSPSMGHPKYWTPVMDALMEKTAPENTARETIRSHANMADLLATSEEPISPEQIYQFCKYLGQKQLSEIKPWIAYRALEQYLLKPVLDLTSVNKALKEYLTQQATKHITTKNNAYFLPNNRLLGFQETTIDPRNWFGINGENYALWEQPDAENGEVAPHIPELLLEVLWTHIQSLQTSCIDRAFSISMFGRHEAELPHHFTLTLAQRITNANIFLDHGNTIDRREFEKPYYGRNLGNLNDAEIEEVAQQYPAAVTIRRNDPLDLI